MESYGCGPPVVNFRGPLGMRLNAAGFFLLSAALFTWLL